MPDLVILNGSRAGAVFALPDIPTVLGRSPEAHVQIEDPWISSMHAMFERRGDDVWVVDLESRNGTFAGEDRISEARITPGMVLRFGRTEVRVAEGSRVAEPLEEPATERTRGESPTEPRSRAEPQRATIRADATEAAALLARAEVDRPDPTALVARPAAVLRLALHATGKGAVPDALAVRAALDAAARAATNEGGDAARLGGSGVVALFGLTAPSPEDAARAVRAARTARGAVRAFGPGLDLRAAVDRGPVLSGTLVVPEGIERTILGEALERAERVLALCAPGEILAGPGAAGVLGLGPGLVLRIGREEMLIYRDESR